MKKSSRIIIAIFVFLILLIGLLAFLPFVIKLDPFIPKIQSSLSQAIGSEVKIGGIKLNIIQGLGVDLKDIKIANPSGFSKENFILVKSIKVRISLLELIKRKFLVKKLALVEPEILVERNSQGRFNFQKLFAKKEKVKDPPENPASAKKPSGLELKVAGRELLINSLAIKKGRLIFKDLQKGLTSNLSSLDLLVKKISSKNPIPVELGFCLSQKCSSKEIFLKGELGALSKGEWKDIPLNFSLKLAQLPLKSLNNWLASSYSFQQGTVSGRAEVKGKISQLALAPQFEIKNLVIKEKKQGWQSQIEKINFLAQLSFEKEPLKIKATNAKLKLGTSWIDFDFSAKKSSPLSYSVLIKNSELALDELVSFYPPIKSHLKASGASLSGKTTLVGKISGSSAQSFDFNVDLTDCNLNYPSYLDKKQGEKLIANVQAIKSGKRINLKKFNLEYLSSQIDLNGDFQSVSPLIGNFSLSANNLNLDEILPSQSQAKKPAVQKEQKKPTQRKSSSLSQINLKGKISIDKLLAKGYTIEKLKSRLKFNQSRLKLTDLFVKAFSGEMTGNIVVNLSKNVPFYQARLKISGMDLSQLLQRIKSLKDNFKGRVYTDLQFKGRGTDWEKVKNQLWAKGKLEVKDGAILTLDLMGSLLGDWINSPSFRSILQQNIGKKEWQMLNQTKFNTLTGDFTVKDGKVKFEPAVMKVEGATMKLKGDFGFDYKVDFDGILRFDKKSSDEIARKLGLSKDAKSILFKNGKILVLPFKLKGTYPKLKAQIDQKKYGKIVSENLKERAKEEIKKQIEKGIKDLLENLVPKL